MSRLTIASWTLSTLGAAAAVVGIGVVPALGRGQGGPHHAVLIESPGCSHPSGHDTHEDKHDTVRGGHGHGDVPSAGAPTQTISVFVPRTALVRLDRSGQIVAAATNTGCAPSALDDVYVVTAAGAVQRSTAIHVATVSWTGDFRSPGVYQTQRR